MAASSVGTPTNPFTSSDSPSLNPALWPGNPSWAVFTARKKQCGSWAGSCGISSMTRNFWPTNRSTRRLCPGSAVWSRSATPCSTAFHSSTSTASPQPASGKDCPQLRRRVLLAPTPRRHPDDLLLHQISQYLSCPRRYRHRYLDGWQDPESNPP